MPTFFRKYNVQQQQKTGARLSILKNSSQKYASNNNKKRDQVLPVNRSSGNAYMPLLAQSLFIAYSIRFAILFYSPLSYLIFIWCACFSSSYFFTPPNNNNFSKAMNSRRRKHFFVNPHLCAFPLLFHLASFF
jgi:hypothetical protein